jgi:DNA helicase-2/ATP-dependent DNA helicase PcrA
VDSDGGQVLLMTLHSAKGLEFPHVYIAGMEEDVFPSYMSLGAEDPETEVEEERRLAYVGFTRAVADLTLCCARQRLVRGETHYNAVSRFLKEIPIELMDNHPGTFRKMKVTVPVREYTAPEKAPYAAGALKRAGIGQGLPTAAEKPDYEKGDRVTHLKYGVGTVKNIEQGPKDYQVTVEFDAAGQKVMYAAFAKLKKV